MANSIRAVVMAALAAAAVTGPATATAFAAPGSGTDTPASYRSPIGDHTRLPAQGEDEQDVTHWFRGLLWGLGGSRQDNTDTDQETDPGPGDTDRETGPGNTDQQTNPGNTDQQTNPGGAASAGQDSAQRR